MFKETWKNYSWIEKAMILSPVALLVCYFTWKIISATFIYSNVPCNAVLSEGWLTAGQALRKAGFENIEYVEVKDAIDKTTGVSDVKIGNKIYKEEDTNKYINGIYFKNTPVVITYHSKSESLCWISYCQKAPIEGHSLCKEHTCMAPGCYEMKSNDYYCLDHKCFEYGCRSRTELNVKYCQNHRCSEPDCYEKIAAAGKKYCSKHEAISKAKSGIKSSGSSKSNSYGKHKVEWPDCDDYDSYEDFMDDWDGNMPYDIDAEDYWENW